MLEEQGIAYQAEDGSVYFRSRHFPDYGKLAHLNLDELRPAAAFATTNTRRNRSATSRSGKRGMRTMATYGGTARGGRDARAGTSSAAPWRLRILGPEIDIHCGGVDNIFPASRSGDRAKRMRDKQRSCGYWMHCAHLMVDGRKMSKSENNFYPARPGGARVGRT